MIKIYTDGSCLNNPGDGGWAAIIHVDNEMKKITIDHPNFGSKWRFYDLNIVSSKKFKQALNNNNIKLVNWREVQNILYPK